MTTPNHYLFPNGRQPIEISRYLSSNGGQALQYIARATRVDSENVKHEDSRSDLRKAIHFLVDEYKRVGGNTDDLKDLLPSAPQGTLLPLRFDTISAVSRYREGTEYYLNGAHFIVPESDKLSHTDCNRINGLLTSGRNNAYLTILS